MKLKKLNLCDISQKEMSQREQNMLSGGYNYRCTCVCTGKMCCCLEGGDFNELLADIDVDTTMESSGQTDNEAGSVVYNTI